MCSEASLSHYMDICISNRITFPCGRDMFVQNIQTTDLNMDEIIATLAIHYEFEVVFSQLISSDCWRNGGAFLITQGVVDDRTIIQRDFSRFLVKVG